MFASGWPAFTGKRMYFYLLQLFFSTLFWISSDKYGMLSTFLCNFGSRSFPAVCGGDVRAVAAGLGCSGRVRGPPALHSVSRLPAVLHLRTLFHVRACWHLLLPPSWPPLPPHWPNHPDSLSLMSVSQHPVNLKLDTCGIRPFSFSFFITISLILAFLPT